MNNWKIPDWLEREVKDRDTQCVYCGIDLTRGSTQSALRSSGVVAV